MNDSEFDESVMSEISVEDEIDCYSFAEHVDEPKRNLIFEASIEFEQIVKNQGLKNLKEKTIVFLKVQKIPNQVFVMRGLDKDDTFDLNSIVKTNNFNCCDDYFWFVPIDNCDETKCLSEKKSWKVKGRYILNL